MYETGSGVAKDEKRAAGLYRLAADQDSAEAQHRLGLMYEEGRAVPKDAREALKLYSRSMENYYPKGEWAYYRLLERLGLSEAELANFLKAEANKPAPEVNPETSK
jgi:TPR repeat protein